MSTVFGGKIDQFLPRETIARIATRSGSSIDAELLPGDVQHLSRVVTDFVMEKII